MTFRVLTHVIFLGERNRSELCCYASRDGRDFMLVLKVSWKRSLEKIMSEWNTWFQLGEF